jgi:hypothetical protein
MSVHSWQAGGASLLILNHLAEEVNDKQGLDVTLHWNEFEGSFFKATAGAHLNKQDPQK